MDIAVFAVLIATMMPCSDVQGIIDTVRSDKFRSDAQIALDPFWPSLVIEANKQLTKKALTHYINLIIISGLALTTKSAIMNLWK